MDFPVVPDGDDVIAGDDSMESEVQKGPVPTEIVEAETCSI